MLVQVVSENGTLLKSCIDAKEAYGVVLGLRDYGWPYAVKIEACQCENCLLEAYELLTRGLVTENLIYQVILNDRYISRVTSLENATRIMSNHPSSYLYEVK